MGIFRDWLVGNGWGPESASVAAIAASLVLLLLVAWVIPRLARAPVNYFFNLSAPWRAALARHRILARITWVLVIILASELLLPHFSPWPSIREFMGKLLDTLMVLTIAAAISGFISILVDFLQQRSIAVRLPVKFLGQALLGVLWTYAAVAMLTVITEQNVASVLTGLTAIGAVLVYVLRDPLMGWTAGLHLAANDLVREGDWISVPKHGADGELEEISLTTVKIRNWDKTVSSVPTYALFGEGFRNWRGMFELGGRRIKRAVAIDASSVRFCDRALLESLSRNPMMRDLGMKADPVGADVDPLSDQRPTNLGCFRQWLGAWLAQHPKIRHDMTFMVRELEPDGRGIPVEIYAFSSDTRWQRYEELQAEILDHVLAVLAEFDLRVFQEPTGEDLRDLATSGIDGSSEGRG